MTDLDAIVVEVMQAVRVRALGAVTPHRSWYPDAVAFNLVDRVTGELVRVTLTAAGPAPWNNPNGAQP